MNNAELKKAKRDVRGRVLALRDAMPREERERVGALAADRFLAMTELDGARLLLAFWAFGSEIPTLPVIGALHERGVRVALPGIDESRLVATTYAPGDPTAETSFGAREPAAGAVVQPLEIDLILAPGVAFDRAGRRIGYGGGFYDRFFPAATRAVRVGFAFGLQVLDEPLPEGGPDQRVDAIVTESETIRCPRVR